MRTLLTGRLLGIDQGCKGGGEEGGGEGDVEEHCGCVGRAGLDKEGGWSGEEGGT